MLGIARIAEKGLLPAAAITAAIAFLGVMAFEMNVMFGLLLTPITILFSAAVLAFVLLRHQEQAAVATALGAGVVVAVAAVVTGQFSKQIVVFIAICWLGTLVVSSVLRQSVSLKAAVLTTVPITVLAGLIGNAYKAQIIDFWQSALMQSLERFSEAELQSIGPESMELMRSSMPQMLAASAASWAFFIILCGVFIARYWQAQLFNAGGFQQEFHSLQLGKETVVVFAIAIALSLILSVSFFAVIASALLFVFFIQGLSVVHCLVKQRGLSRSWLTGMYIFLWFPPAMPFLGVLGMADNFIRLRKI